MSFFVVSFFKCKEGTQTKKGIKIFQCLIKDWAIALDQSDKQLYFEQELLAQIKKNES